MTVDSGFSAQGRVVLLWLVGYQTRARFEQVVGLVLLIVSFEFVLFRGPFSETVCTVFPLP